METKAEGSRRRRAIGSPPRSLAVLILSFAIAGAPVGARAETTVRSRLDLTVDLRGEIGVGDQAGIDLGLLGVGAGWWTTPTLRLGAEALLLGATGSTADDRSASRGAGGELDARIVPFPRWAVRPYLRMSAGMLLFLRRPFLPGGDVYDFVLEAGGGLEVPIGDRLSLFGDLHLAHLSNGQGLGAFNPAFGGEGGLVGADYALAPREADALASTPHPPVDEARPGWQPGATFDAEIGNVNGDLELGLRDRVAQRLSRRALAVLDAESGELAGAHFLEVGVDLAGHWTAASAGVHGGYRRYAGVSTYVEQVQLEANLTEEASLVAMGNWEIPDGFADTYRGAAILRVFPIDTVLVELGGGYQRVGSAPLNSGGTVYFAAEWQLPFHARTWQLSLFAVRQIDDLQLGGVRISWDMGATLRDLARQTGWRRVR